MYLLPLLAATGASALSIGSITGTRFLSPYNGQDVTNVTGVVTAKGTAGIYIRGLVRPCDTRRSNSIYLYGSTLAKNASIAVGDVLTINGKVAEYRSSVDYVYLTEITGAKITASAKGTNATMPKAKVIGKDTPSPPTQQYSGLDNGDVFGVPNNVSQISVANPELQPDKYGMDFWESLSGELVTIKNPVGVGKPNQYGDTWVIGDWAVTGKNGRGGLTLSAKDGNPEAVLIATPLDGSKNRDDYKIGDKYEDITGVVQYSFGFYAVLPMKNLTRISSAEPEFAPPTTLVSTGKCSGLTVGSYNIENFKPSETAHVAAVAKHIVEYMKTPDLLHVQEVQDENGATNNGVVNANKTLETLINAITAISPSTPYGYAQIDPVNLADGGQPGGNIRVAYLYRTDVLKLSGNATSGGSLDKNEVLSGPTLKYNPGRIDPTNAVWVDSRKPLAAEWVTLDGTGKLFTVNVHWESKGGSTSLQGDARPPVNLPVEKRTQQANVTASFIADILKADPKAAVFMAGDCNEYQVAQPITIFKAVSGLADLDDAAGIPDVDRYSYTFGSNMQELDHLFVSPSIVSKGPKVDHLHLNTWLNYDDAVSDHDPAVAVINICKA